MFRVYQNSRLDITVGMGIVEGNLNFLEFVLSWRVTGEGFITHVNFVINLAFFTLECY